jgi:flavin reductase (DIM6/NTAB) family NADH-FMN oxidoreductase RutF
MDKNAAQLVGADQFRLGMRSLAAAVTLITTAHAGHRYGMTATAVTSVSAEPPALLVCVNRKASTHDAIGKSRMFCINVLRAEHVELSRAFSGTQSGEGRFRSEDWTRLATGAPVLVDALVSFDCRVEKEFAHGTHTLFIGSVEHIVAGKKGRSLLYTDGQYGKLATLGERVLPGELPDSLDWI